MKKNYNDINEENSDFFKAIQLITLFGMFICILIVVLINIFNVEASVFTDIKSIFLNIIVGLFFSFLIAIKSIRSYIVGSVASFMGEEEYLKKLNPEELVRIRDKSYNILYGTDIATNQESLFNYFKKLDEHLVLPHKSMVNEEWLIKFNESGKYYKTKRIQDYRVHTLDLKRYNSFDIIYKCSAKVEKEHCEDFKKDFFLEVLIEGISKVKIEHLPNEEKNEYFNQNKFNDNTGLYEISFKYNLKLESEFTKVKVITERLEEIDSSLALVSKNATYGSHYNIKLPDKSNITGVYHNDTLFSKEKKQVTSEILEINQVCIDISGWQLPGLIFVVTYDKLKN